MIINGHPYCLMTNILNKYASKTSIAAYVIKATAF